MNTKEKLIEKISHIEDESILEEIMEIVQLELELGAESIRLTQEQKVFIDEGLKNIESGNIIPDEEAKKMTREWLKRR
ncbi:MAG: hypothetical protein U5K79_15460 [Cyclobacteriaceae bacterium]|nr:hypothetical protein [Cyclobacteriaceae bacterium]